MLRIPGTESFYIFAKVQNSCDCFISEKGMNIPLYKIYRLKLICKRTGIYN